MSRTTLTVTTEIDLDIETAAKWFAALSDDEMCQFLVAVAAEAEKWPDNFGGPDTQWYYVGGHLRNCECSTEGAREMIRAIAGYMETSTHGAPDEPLAAE
jgi:hypothetical protein